MGFLRLEGLVKRYGDFTAVERVDLDVEKGEFVSLLGPSGCGKTTTLQMIAGFTPPTEGRVYVGGRDITDEKPNRRDLGIVFQSYALFPHMSVAQNVAFGLEMRRVGRRERRERVAEALDLVRLTEFADRFPRALSGGQRQRVALARALVINPEVLLLDEPLSALDAKIREDMQVELRDIQRRIGTTTILVTHDQAEAMAMSDRIAVMNKGRLVQVDEPFAAYERPGDSFVSSFLGKSNSFDGVVRGASEAATTIEAAGRELSAHASDFAPGTSVLASIRPEKVALVPSGEGLLDGTVEKRIFLGNHWVFHVSTPAGLIVATSHNAQPQPIGEREAVGLDWRSEDVRLLRREAADVG